MAVDRQRLAEALAYEQQRRRMMESVPTVGNLPPAQPARRSLRTDLENLSSGLGRGIVNQLEGVKGLVTDPVGTVKGAYEGVKGIVRDPSVLADALRYTADKAMSGPLGSGEVLGEFLTPSVKGVGKRDIFIGENARTWDAAAAKRAEEMEASGIDPETIWRETGTYRGTDNQLRQEIPDEMAFKPGYGLPGGRSRAYNVNEAVFNPSMRATYPDIMEETLTTMRVKPDVPETGYFQERVPATRETFGLDPEIGVTGRNRPEIKSVLAHELQHAVQAKEGFARGGNPDQFKIMSAGEREETINRLRRKIGQMAADRHRDGEFIISGFERAKPETLADPEIRDMMYELKRIETMADPREQYKRLAGEAEARAVQSRLGMTKEQRRQTYPFKSYDVPLDELINRK